MKKLIVMLLFACSLLPVVAETVSRTATLSGTVTHSEDGSALVGATIYFPDLQTGTTTDVEGRYSIAGLPLRSVTIQVSYIGHQTIMRQIDLATTSSMDFSMHESNAQINEVVVTGTNGKALLSHMPTPVDVITAAQLGQSASTNIIDAIAHKPGMAQITTGGGISKPVIRGLGYNRIVVVNDGVRQEGQQWGDEHGIEVDANSVGSVEVLKGPASLMYGSDAIAGVVIFNNVPTLAQGKMRLTPTAEYQTNNGLINYSLDFAGNSHGIAWDWRWSQKLAHAYKNKFDGRVLNSQFRDQALSGLLGVNRSWGYSRLHLSYYAITPGITEGERDETTGRFLKPIIANGEADETIATADDLKTYGRGMPYQRVKHYKAVVDNAFFVGPGTLNVTLGYQHNRRREFEEVLTPDESGLDMMLHTGTYNIYYALTRVNGWKLNGGLSGMYQRSVNKGEEFLIPDYQLFDAGAYVTTSFGVGRWNVSGGLRVDNRHVHGFALADRFAAFSRNFTGVTGSVGAVYDVAGNLHLRLNVARGYRAPNISELAANGEHEGTFRYEVGNADMKPEYSWQADAGLDYTSAKVTAGIALFANFIDNYIFAHRQPGEEVEGTPVFRFTQGSARLMGGEITLDVHPVERLHIGNAFSYVSAVQRHQPADRKYLPFTPAPRWTMDVRYDLLRHGRTLNNAFIKAGMECNLRQNHAYTADGTETPTPGYTLIDLSAGTDICHRGRTVATVTLSAENLLDRAYQSHLSRLKYAPTNNLTGRTGVYDMGRNVCVKLNLPIEF